MNRPNLNNYVEALEASETGSLGRAEVLEILRYALDLEGEKIARGLLEPQKVTLVRERLDSAPDGKTVRNIEILTAEVAVLEAETKPDDTSGYVMYGAWMIPQEFKLCG